LSALVEAGLHGLSGLLMATPQALDGLFAAERNDSGFGALCGQLAAALVELLVPPFFGCAYCLAAMLLFVLATAVFGDPGAVQVTCGVQRFRESVPFAFSILPGKLCFILVSLGASDFCC
jgi:hypothetical protein